MKAATIYERDEKVYVHSLSKTTAGVWVINAPVLTARKEDLDQFGRSVRLCLEASIEGVPHPKSFLNSFYPVLALSGVKSFNVFVKTAKCVEVEMAEDIVTLISTRNEGAEDGFVPLSGKTQVAGGTDQALGSAASAALAIAE